MLFGLLVVPGEEPYACDDADCHGSGVADGAAEVECHRRDEEECGADGRHENSGDEGDEEWLLLLYHVDGDGPQGVDGEGLIGPAEPLPDGVEAVWVLHLPDEEADGGGKHWYGDEEAPVDALLVEVDGVGDDEPCAAEGSVTAGDRCCHDTEDGEDAAKEPEPACAGLLYDVRSREELDKALATVALGQEGVEGVGVDDITPAAVVEEIDGHGGPDKGYDTLCYHGAVEDGTP